MGEQERLRVDGGGARGGEEDKRGRDKEGEHQCRGGVDTGKQELV